MKKTGEYKIEVYVVTTWSSESGEKSEKQKGVCTTTTPNGKGYGQ